MNKVQFFKDLFKNKVFLSILLIAMCVVQISFVLDYDINSTKFFPRTISLLFLALIVNAATFTTFFLIIRKRMLLLPLSLGLALSNTLIYLVLYKVSLFGVKLTPVINDFLGEHLVTQIFRLNFVKVSMADGNFSWVVALCFYFGIGLVIYGQWFIKKKEDYDSKIEKQVVFMGLGLYLLLFPFVFAFTHFTFVGSNYQYIQGIIQYTDSSVSVYEKSNQKEHFQIKDLRWFPDIKKAISYYKDQRFTQNIVFSNSKNEFYQTAMQKLEQIETGGWKSSKDYTYDNMDRFQDWIQIAYNFSLDGVNVPKRTLWYSEISPVLTDPREGDQDLLRHSVLYLHEASDGGCYIMVSFDRTFKDHKMNYVFNFFFILYHLVYLGLFLYLIVIHRKKHLRKSHANDK